jgi:aryl-alcohol dehydrogenase-like predicted oxidoreductase
METRRLGRTQLTVSAAGVHASWRERDAAEARKTLTTAMELGVDVVLCDPAFDRALERIVGEVVRDLRLRDKAQVITQVGPPAHPKAVQAAVEASLRATRLEALPFALVDWDDRTFYDKRWPETRAHLDTLVREGKVLRWGMRPAGALDTASMGPSEPGFELIALPYNLFARDGVDALLAAAKRHDAGVVITQPLHHGLLTGAWHRETRFAPGDWRADRYADLAPHLAAIDKLRPLATRETDELAELALRFALGRDEVTVVAPSIRARAHLDTLVRAADGRRLSDSLQQRLDEETGRAP